MGTDDFDGTKKGAVTSRESERSNENVSYQIIMVTAKRRKLQCVESDHAGSTFAFEDNENLKLIRIVPRSNDRRSELRINESRISGDREVKGEM